MRNKMKKHFYGIQKKLLLYSVGLILAMAVVFTVLILRLFANVQDTIHSQNISMTENMLYKFDLFYHEMDDVTQKVIADRNVQSYISKRGLTITERETLERAISNSSNSMSYFFVNNLLEVYSNRNGFLNKIGFQDTVLYQKLGGDYAKTHFIWQEEDVFGIGGRRLYVGRNIQSIDRIEKEAKIYFPVSREKIMERILSENLGEQTAVVFSDEGEVCFTRNEAGEEDRLEQEERIKKIFEKTRVSTRDNSIYMVRQPEGILYAGYHALSGFTVCTFLTTGTINRMVWETFGWLFLVLLLIFLLAAFLSVSISNYFSAPIRKISEVMDHFGMDALDGQIEIKTNTELDRIGNAYNGMLDSIKELLGMIRAKEREVRELEMESLLYQINPHFLYNTFDNIYMMARIHHQTQTMEMVDALAKFLRVTLSHGKEIISLKQELEHVCSYMKIQQIRNSDLFIYELSCPKETESYGIPKMILQPLVENCIEHGFSDLEEGGIIGIEVFEESGKLVLAVSNNGKVMDEHQAERMNAFLRSGGKNQGSYSSKASGGYGVRNVIRRLKLKYGDSVFMAYSVRNDRTLCRIEIETGDLKKEAEA